MKAPDKIYMPNELLSEEWQRHIEGEDTEYIRKDALLKWLEERMTKEGATEGFVGGYDFALKDVINKLNEL